MPVRSGPGVEQHDTPLIGERPSHVIGGHKPPPANSEVRGRTRQVQHRLGRVGHRRHLAGGVVHPVAWHKAQYLRIQRRTIWFRRQSQATTTD